MLRCAQVQSKILPKAGERHDMNDENGEHKSCVCGYDDDTISKEQSFNVLYMYVQYLGNLREKGSQSVGT